MTDPPQTKPASEYERAVTPDIEEQHQLPSSVEESIETTTSRVHLEPRSPIIEPVQIEPEHKKPVVHLEPRPATIEPVEKIDTNEPPLITSLLTTETPSKTTTLHGAAVDLPEIQLVTPGPLPTLPIGKHSKKPKTKVKKEKIEASTSPKKVSGGLCASCFGKKAAEKKKKQETISSLETKAPIEQKKIIEEEKKQDSSPAPPVVLTTTTTTEEPPLPPPTTTTETHSSVLPKIDIDTFKPRDFGKGAENLPKPDDYLGATLEPLVHIEEPHYQLPSGEPVPPIPIPIENEYSMPESDRNTYDIPRSIEIDQIHVDNETMLTRTSDMQRSGGDFVLTPTPVLVDEKSIGLDDASKLPTVTIESSSPIASRIDTTMPRVDIDESANKGSYTLPAVKTKKSKIKEPKPKKEKKEKKVKEPKSEKKSHSSSGLFGGLFRGSNRKSATIQVPALDLPPVERDLSPENNEPHRRTSDSFHIPAVDLPKPNIPLPTYDRPEVDMMTGTSRHSSEFAVPSVNLPVLVDVQLPVDDQQNKAALLSSKDLMHIPHVELPEVQFTSEIPIQSVQHEQKTEIVKVIDYQGKPVESGPTLESGLILSSPVSDMLSIQTDHTTFPIETDYAAPALVKDLPATEETTIISPPPPPLPTFPSVDETPITQPELLSTEQKYTITDTHFVQPPELTPPLTETKPSDIESPPKLPDFSFELPSLEPISTSPKRTAPPPPSFDDDVPSSSPKLVPAVEPLTAITPQIDVESKPQPGEKQRIDATIGKIKLPTTGGLCSCFGEKSKKAPAPTTTPTPTETVPKEKKVKKAKKEKKTSTKPIAVPTTDLPEVKIPVPSSNISSTLKTKGSLRAPAADLPPVDLKAPESEPIRLSLATKSHEKKRKAPKVPPATESKVASTPESQQVPPPTSSETVPIDVPDFALKGPSITIPSLDLEPKAKPPTPPPSPVVEPQPVAAEEIETKDKKTSAFEIKAPAVTIPDLDLSGPGATDAYMSSTSKPQPIVAQSRSDSGLEAIISSHMHSSSTFGTKSTIDESTAVLPDTSVSSGLGSEILDGVATKGYTLTDLKQQQQPPISDETQQQSLKRDSSLLRHDFARKITMNDEIRAKLIYRQSELKKLLETEIAQSIDDFDTKKDGKALSKILGHGIDLVKDKKVTTYPDLKQKLIIDHKHEAFIVDPVVRSLYVTIEQQGLDNLDKPEFPLAVRDMVRLPAKQTFETIAHLNKDSTPGGSLTNEGTQMTTTTKEISVADVGTTNQSAPISQNQQTPPTDVARSCLTCGRSKSKTKKPSAPTTSAGTNNSVSTHPVGLLDERRRLQLASHRTELGNILRDHLLSTQPPIRRFPDHPKEVDKIIRKSLVLVAQPKILSYEQLRNDLKTEYKHTFYLIDPTIDVIRDTFDHCDITQMHEKINIDILDANIAQTAALYNQTELQTNLLTNEEFELMKTKQQQPWLRDYLREREVKEKKLHRKQNKELGKILDRTLEILPLNQVQTWDELAAQLRREYPKAHDLCDRSVELIKQGQKDGLLTQRQAPGTTTQQQDVTSINILNGGQRRPSSLITERARQNLKTNRSGIISSFGRLLVEYNKPLYQQNQIEIFINETLNYLEQQQQPNGLFRDYNDVKERLKKDHKQNHDKLIGQIVDVIEQAHAVNQFDDLEKSEVQTLMRDRLNGKPLILKEMYVSLPPRVGAYGSTRHGDDPSSSSGLFSTSGSHLINGDPSLNNSSASHRVGRGLSWREANERARILFYRGKHPAIHYDEQSDGFDVRMLLETNSGGTQEIPVTDSDVHELLNSCGVQWDGVNLISLVDHSEVLVRAAEEAALKVIREKGVVDLRPPPTPSATDEDELEVPPPPSSSTPTASSS